MEKEYYLEHINKDNKHSETKTEKYRVINCQKIIDRNYDTSKWIKLDDIIKETSDLKIFKGVLISKQNIVIKIGYSGTILREYKISHLLIDINCFITYVCYFSCKNNIQNILYNKSICSNDGNKIYVLIMKEYKLGDMKKYNWNKDNFIMLLSLIKCIMISLYMAFKKYGFIHNDVHFGNILIKETTRKELLFDERISVKLYGYEPKIMDFETINKKYIIFCLLLLY